MKTKTCLSCKETKPLSEFGANGTLRSGKPRYKPRCRSCNHNYEKEVYYKKIVKALGGIENVKCTVCKYNKYRGALEFHHTNPTEKEYAITKMQNYTYKKIKKEVDKCVLLCSNCHREVHAGLLIL